MTVLGRASLAARHPGPARGWFRRTPSESLALPDCVDLRSWSTMLYPKWSSALREETGIDNGYRRNGGLDVAVTPEDELALRTAAGPWRVEGITYERMAPGRLSSRRARVEPRLECCVFPPETAPDPRPTASRRWRLVETRGVTLGVHREVVGFSVVGDVHGRPYARRRRPVVWLRGGRRGAVVAAFLNHVGVDAPTRLCQGAIVPVRRIDIAVADRRARRPLRSPRDDGRILVARDPKRTPDLIVETRPRCNPGAVR